MHDWSHKSVRESKSRKKTQNPSFSSSLLDEIYRSMDAGNVKPSELKLWQDTHSRKASISGGDGGSRDGGRARASGAVEDEGIATLRRAFLVQKWIDMKVNARNFTHRRRASSLPVSDDKKPSAMNDDDQFWSSDLVYRWSQRPSCFGPFKPKPIKTQQIGNDNYSGYNNHTKRMDHGNLINPNMKKVEQPISPGVRLTTFLNSLFTNGRLKKPKDLNNQKIERTSKSTHGSQCSSASSFTRSCLSKNSPRSREKLNHGNRRTVRFYPVSVIIDEDCRPCGEKSIFGEQDLMKVHVTTMSEDKLDDDYDEDDDDDDDDMVSDASSDLFELDHLTILKECDELPVYGTTHFGTNRAIANGLLC